MQKYKSRVCAWEYFKKQGIDYKEFFIPVVLAESLRLVLDVGTSRDIIIHVFTAFLYGTPKEDICEKQGYPLKKKLALTAMQSMIQNSFDFELFVVHGDKNRRPGD